ncbi:MAG: hypothetical protein ACOZBH_02370 [Patescibacteria group bacterium]
MFLILAMIFNLSYFNISSKPAEAAASQFINYQGKLLDTSGIEVDNGQYHVRFKMYNAGTGGSLLWSESWDNTTTTATVDAGLFTLKLGEVNPFPATLDFQTESEYWLSVEIGGSGATPTWDGEMTPRKEITAVAYAMNADKLDGKSEEEFADLSEDETITGQYTHDVDVFDGAALTTIINASDDNSVDTFSSLQADAVQNSNDGDNLYGIYVTNLQGTASTGNEYAIYQAGTGWDYGLYVEDQAYLGQNLRFSSNFDVKNTIIASVNIMDVQSIGTNSMAFRVIPGTAPAYSALGETQASFFEFHRNSSGTDRMLLTAPTNATNGYQFVSYAALPATPGPFSFGFTTSLAAPPTKVMNIFNTGSVGINTFGPDAKLDVLATSGEQLRLTYTDGSVYTGFTVNSDGDLIVDATGSDIRLATGDNLWVASSADIVIGNTYLGESTAQIDSGAYNVGVYNGNLTYSTNTNVQQVLEDLDTAIGSAGSKWTDAGSYTYLTATTDNLVVGSNATADAELFMDVADKRLHIGSGYIDFDFTGSGNTAVGDDSLYSITNGTHNSSIGYQAMYYLTSGYDNTALGYQALRIDSSGTGGQSFGNTAIGSLALSSINTSAAVYNTAIGVSSLQNNTTGLANTAIGALALDSNVIGASNVALGYSTLQANVSGDYNVALGAEALDSLTSADANIAIGYKAMDSTTTGQYNVALGHQSLRANISADYSTALGYQALYSNTASNITAVGAQAMYSNGTGTENVAMGYQSLYSNDSGDQHTAIGYQSLYSLSANVDDNTAVGYRAMYSNLAGGQSTAIGSQALYNALAPGYSTAVGYQALYATTTGDYNIAVGNQSMVANTTGSDNVSIGVNALDSNTTGNYNIAIGRQSLQANISADYSTALGYQALYSNTASNITAVGAQAMYSNGTGTENVAMGYQSLYSNDSGDQHTAIGYQSLYSLSANVDDNTAVGYRAMYSNLAGGQSTAIGSQALYNALAPGYSTAVGYQALYATTTGDYNIAVGNQSMVANTTGSDNVSIGVNALDSNTTGNYNIAIGRQSLQANISADYSTALGYQALYSNTASNITAVGAQALYSNTSGTGNAALGYQSLYSNTSGNNNSAFGYQSLFSHASGNDGNTAMGYRSMYSMTAGALNTSIGTEALYSALSTSGNVAIGYRAGYFETGNNRLFIDNNSRSDEATGRVRSLIYGEFASATADQLLRINGLTQIQGHLIPYQDNFYNIGSADYRWNNLYVDDAYVLKGATNINLESSGTPTTSGAYAIGANDEFTYSDSTNVQDVLDDLDAALASAGSKWTDAGDFTHLTSTIDDVVIGASTTEDAVFWFDVTDNAEKFSIDASSDAHTTAALDIDFRGDANNLKVVDIYAGSASGLSANSFLFGQSITLGYNAGDAAGTYRIANNVDVNGTNATSDIIGYAFFDNTQTGQDGLSGVGSATGAYSLISHSGSGSLTGFQNYLWHTGSGSVTGFGGSTSSSGSGTVYAANPQVYGLSGFSGSLYGYRTSMTNSSGSTQNMLGFDINVTNNAGASADSLWGGKITVKASGTEDTAAYGLQVVSDTDLIDSLINLAVVNGGSAGYGFDMNGATIATADIRLSNGSTIDNLTSTVVAFSDGIRIGNTADTTAGNIRWSGADFEGYNGAGWQSLTSGGGSLWTDAGTYTYLTATQDDLLVGSSNNASRPLYFDVSNMSLEIGSGDTLNARLYMYSQDGDSGLIEYAASDRFEFYDQIWVQGYIDFDNASADTAVGYVALNSNTTGTDNSAFGYQALVSNTTGSYNTGIGASSLISNNTGLANTALGASSLFSNQGGSNNTAIGVSALYSNVSGASNVAIGSGALGASVGEDYNVAIGAAALANSSGGTANSVIGFQSLTNNIIGDYNSALGYRSLYNATGDYNVAIGSDSLFSNINGDSNIAIGSYAGYHETGSNTLYIDSIYRSNEADGQVKSLIYGEFASATADQLFRINGNMEVQGNLSPLADDVYNLGSADSRWANLYLGPASLYIGQNGNDYSISYNTGSSALVFNESGADRDIRIEGDTDTNLFFVNAGSDRIGIGLNNPAEKLEVSGAIKLGTTSNTNAGTIRWTGADFEGYDGAGWQSLTSGGGSLWTDVGDFTHLTSTIDDVVIGSDATEDAVFWFDVTDGAEKLTIDASSDAHSSAVAFDVNFRGSANNLKAVDIYAGSSAGLTGAYNNLMGQNITVGINAADQAGTMRIGSNVNIDGTNATADVVGYTFWDFVDTGQGGFTGVGSATGLYPIMNHTGSGSLYGVNNYLRHSGSGSLYVSAAQALGASGFTGSLYGNSLTMVNQAGSNAQNIMGFDLNVTNSSSATADSVIGGKITVDASGAEDIAAYGLQVVSKNALVDSFIYLASQTGGSAGYGLDMNGATIATADIRLSGGSTIDNSTSTIIAFSDGIRIGNTADTTAGNIRWSGADFEGYDGAGWQSLTSGGGSLWTDAGAFTYLTATTDDMVVGSAATSDAELWFNVSGKRLTIGSGYVDFDYGTGTDNVGIGSNTLTAITTGSYNIGIGTGALQAATDNNGLTAVGYQALYTNSSIGTNNTAVGYRALYLNNGGDFNTALGYEALDANVSGSNSVAIGYRALTNSTGSGNVAVGSEALLSAVGSTNIVAIGYGAVQDLTSNGEVVGVGYNSLANATGAGNTAIGYIAGQGNAASATGTANTAVGRGTLSSFSTGNNNVAVGYNALDQLSTGTYNIALGTNALGAAVTGSNNIAIGNSSSLLNTSGIDNIALGFFALSTNTAGQGNVGIGRNSLRNGTGSYNVALGYEAGYRETGSNTLYIDNQDRGNEASGEAESLIYGVFDNVVSSQLFRINAPTQVQGNLIPYHDNVYNLGSPSNRWNNIYTDRMIMSSNADLYFDGTDIFFRNFETNGDITLDATSTGTGNVIVVADNWAVNSSGNMSINGDMTVTGGDLNLSSDIRLHVSGDDLQIQNAATGGDIYLDPTYNGSSGFVFVSGDLMPVYDDTFDIGSPDLRWQDGYFSGQVYVGNTLEISDDGFYDTDSAIGFFPDGQLTRGLAITDDVTVGLAITTNASTNLTILPNNADLDVRPTANSTDFFQVQNAAGTAIFNVDSSNSRVGINTAAPDYALDVAGSVGMDDYIYHNGDSNTYLGFSADDTLVVYSYGVKLMEYYSSSALSNSVTGNPDNNRVNFVWDGDTNDSLFRIAALQEQIGIGATGGAASMDGKLVVYQTATADIFNLYDGSDNVFTVTDGGNVGIRQTSPASDFEILSDNSTTGATMQLRRNDGAVLDGDDLGYLYFSGLDSGDTLNATGAYIKAEATDTWGDASDPDDAPTAMHFYTQNDGTGNNMTFPMMTIYEDIGVGLLLNGNLPQATFHMETNKNGYGIRMEEYLGGGAGDYWEWGVNAAGDLNWNDNGTTRISYKNGGDVGIGTSGPGAKLEIYDNDDVGVALEVNSDESDTAAQNVFQIRTDYNAADDLVFVVDADGTVRNDNGTYTTGADYAEYFWTADMTLATADVVCIDPTHNNAVSKCSGANDANILGVVSTNPAFIGNAGSNWIFDGDPNYVIIGLVGQVPIRVSNENGPISVGDYLTSSSTPGVAMKADPGSPTVGIAIEPLTAGAGIIKVVISRNNGSNTFWAAGNNGIYQNNLPTIIGPDAAFSYVQSAAAGDLQIADDFEARGDGYVGANMIVGASTSAAETLANAGFAMNGNDLFVAGDAGIEGNIYTDGSFIAGPGTTTYSDGSITSTNTMTITSNTGDLTLDSGSGTLKLGAGTNAISNSDAGADLTLNSNGDINFFNSNNSIDSGGNLNLAGDINIGGSLVVNDMRLGDIDIANGAIASTGDLTIASGASQDLTLDSDSGTLKLGAGTNEISNTDASADLTIKSEGNINFFDANTFIDKDGNLTLAGQLQAAMDVIAQQNVIIKNQLEVDQIAADDRQEITVMDEMVFEQGLKVSAKTDTTVAGTQVNVAGFGNANNQTSRAAAVYNGKLYVGTYNTSNGAGLWAYDGSNWASVDTNGFGNANNTSINSMIAYGGGLIVGTRNTNKAEVWICDDTDTCSQQNLGATFDGNNDAAQAMTVYNGKLFMGTDNAIDNSEIWQFIDTNNWLMADNTNGFLSTYQNDALTALLSIGSQLNNEGLLAGTKNNSGAQIWRRGSNFTWTRIDNSSFGDINNVEVMAMTAYNGQVFAATKNSSGCRVYKQREESTSWDAAGSAGLINSAYTECRSIVVYNGDLYALLGKTSGAGMAVAKYNAMANSWSAVYTNASDLAGYWLQTFGEKLYFAAESSGQVKVFEYNENKNLSQSIEFMANGETAALYFKSDAAGDANIGQQSAGAFIMTHTLITNSGAYDLAEDWPTEDPGIEAGDVVAVDPFNKAHVIKGSKDNSAVGIISTEPGYILSQKADGRIYRPVALAGRVPVKISNENGPVKAGDLLTPASIPGYAMKLIGSGPVIGKALEDYDFSAAGDSYEVSQELQSAAQQFDEIAENTMKLVENTEEVVSSLNQTKQELLSIENNQELTAQEKDQLINELSGEIENVAVALEIDDQAITDISDSADIVDVQNQIIEKAQELENQAMQAEIAKSQLIQPMAKDPGKGRIMALVMNSYYFESTDGQTAGQLAAGSAAIDPQSVASVDFAEILTVAGDGAIELASSVRIYGDLYVNGNLVVTGDIDLAGNLKIGDKIYISNQMSGTALIASADATAVEVKFDTPYEEIPRITVTPELLGLTADENIFDVWDGRYIITDKSTEGFTINIANALCVSAGASADVVGCQHHLRFDWVAFGVVSDEESLAQMVEMTAKPASTDKEPPSIDPAVKVIIRNGANLDTTDIGNSLIGLGYAVYKGADTISYYSTSRILVLNSQLSPSVLNEIRFLIGGEIEYASAAGEYGDSDVVIFLGEDLTKDVFTYDQQKLLDSNITDEIPPLPAPIAETASSDDTLSEQANNDQPILSAADGAVEDEETPINVDGQISDSTVSAESQPEPEIVAVPVGE